MCSKSGYFVMGGFWCWFLRNYFEMSTLHLSNYIMMVWVSLVFCCFCLYFYCSLMSNWKGFPATKSHWMQTLLEEIIVILVIHNSCSPSSLCLQNERSVPFQYMSCSWIALLHLVRCFRSLSYFVKRYNGIVFIRRLLELTI